MITDDSIAQADDHDAAVATQQLASRITRALSEPGDSGLMTRVEVPLPGVEPLHWLYAQKDVTQYYWSSRDDAFEMAGVGEAHTLSPKDGSTDVFDEMRALLPSNRPSLRYYGGFRFHPGEVKGGRWKAFGDYRFVIPRFEVVRRESKTVLACNFRVSDSEDNKKRRKMLLEGLGTLRFPVEEPAILLPSVLERTDSPDRRNWDRLVGEITEAIDGGDLKKVVLARETVFTTKDELDPVGLLILLLRRTTQSFEFCFHPARDRAFIGASPERLFRRINCLLQSEAIAGTRPRGKTDEDDKYLGERLLGSEKDRREHDFVVRMLKKNFKKICRHVSLEEAPSLMLLRNCQHLRTKIEGVLEDTEVDAELIRALHPTPAVGGVPRRTALKWLEENEPFDRGIYASPVGWVGFDAAEFCVAIRSGLIQGNTAALYTGAGIVAGSTPEEEWAEIEYKMKNFVHALKPYE